MSAYTLHLGFNWDAAPVGAIWNTKPSDYRFLQYALADKLDAAAWFTFDPNDELTVVIWDLSLSAAPSVGTPVLAMSFGPLVAGDDADSYDPTTLVDTGGAVVEVRTVAGEPQHYLSFANAITGAIGTCPWGPSRGSYIAGGIKLTAPQIYKLSFCLTVTATTGEARAYLSDPEVIVGSQGHPSPKPHRPPH